MLLLAQLSFILAYHFVVPVLSNIQENVPVCPQKLAQEQEFPYVVYGRSKARCYVASRQGPCSEGSILFAKPKSHLGVCSCECFLSEGIVFDDSSIERYRYCYNKRAANVFVYDKSRGCCYQLGSRGPCPKGQVLQKDIYEYNPKCVNDTREDISSSPHTPIEEEECPPGTIYSTLLNECTDMMFTGLPPTSGTRPTTERPNGGSTCPPGTIYSTLLNQCTDMMFTGLPPGTWTTTSPIETTGRPQNGGNTCPPGTIYSTLLNICTDMMFTGLPPSSGTRPTTGRPSGGSTCPPGTIYSTLLNKCTDMMFTGLPPSGSPTRPPTEGTTTSCPIGTIYSTLLNRCTDMNFRGLTKRDRNDSFSSKNYFNVSLRKCPPGTIYSTLLNRCTDMNFRGLNNTSSWKRCPQGTIYSTQMNRCTDMSFRVITNNYVNN